MEAYTGQSNRGGSLPSKEVGQPRACLKCMYTNVCSLGNQQEKLDVCVQLKSCDDTGIRDMMGEFM